MMTMNGKRLLYIDQYGNTFFASTVKELREKVGGGRIAKMYQDTASGEVLHVGYVIGRHWLSMYAPYTKPATF